MLLSRPLVRKPYRFRRRWVCSATKLARIITIPTAAPPAIAAFAPVDRPPPLLAIAAGEGGGVGD